MDKSMHIRSGGVVCCSSEAVQTIMKHTLSTCTHASSCTGTHTHIHTSPRLTRAKGDSGLQDDVGGGGIHGRAPLGQDPQVAFQLQRLVAGLDLRSKGYGRGTAGVR